MAEHGRRPLVTFALFAYNQEKYIREAVEGAFAQTYSPLEIILSDDCSTDRTFEIMQEMAAAYDGPHRVLVRRNERNLGLADHINAVHTIASGDLITWSAGDDIALPERTKEFVNALSDDAGCLLVHSALLEIDMDSNVIGTRIHEQELQNPDPMGVINRMRGVVTQSFCFNKALIDKFGPLQSWVTQEAIVYGFRAAVTGGALYIREPMTMYRVGSGISTREYSTMREKKILEPVKVIGWRISAAHQMLLDIYCIEIDQHDRIVEALKREIEYYSRVQNINIGRHVIGSTIRASLLFPKRRTHLRALARRMQLIFDPRVHLT